jgi:hypothetical protein
MMEATHVFSLDAQTTSERRVDSSIVSLFVMASNAAVTIFLI